MTRQVLSLVTARAEARAVARSRHPTTRAWVPDRSRLLERLAERAHARGAPWPRVAAAAVLLRGVAGDDLPGFARRLGVAPADLARLERGVVPLSAVPPRLRAIAGLVDWGWVGAGDSGAGDVGGGAGDAAGGVVGGERGE
jgi:hypothetical protein